MERPQVGPGGRVLSVDSTGKLTIPVGFAERLPAGTELVVARCARYVATIRVLEVSENSATAQVVPGMQTVPVAVGDRVLAR